MLDKGSQLCPLVLSETVKLAIGDHIFVVEENMITSFSTILLKR
jgi:hypothetical protein